MATNIPLLFSEAHCCTIMINANHIYTAFGKWDNVKANAI